MENNDFQNTMRKLIYEEFQKRLEEQMQPKEDTSQLDEFDYDETKNILFNKLKELSTRKFETEENYLESCRIMDNIAMTLLETE
jgi:hypothetical protein